MCFWDCGEEAAARSAHHGDGSFNGSATLNASKERVPSDSTCFNRGSCGMDEDGRGLQKLDFGGHCEK